MEGLAGGTTAYRLVLRRCRAILGSLEEAEDATQEVFARAAAAGKAEQVGWLLSVARFVCADELRRRDRTNRAQARMGLEDVVDPEPRAVGDLLLDQVLRQLSPAEGRLLLYRLRTAASLREAAQDLGMAASTARNLAMRIRRKLGYLVSSQLGPLPIAVERLQRFVRRARRYAWYEPALAPVVVAVIAITAGVGLGQEGVPAPIAHPAAVALLAVVPRPSAAVPAGVALARTPTTVARPRGDRQPPPPPGAPLPTGIPVIDCRANPQMCRTQKAKVFKPPVDVPPYVWPVLSQVLSTVNPPNQ